MPSQPKVLFIDVESSPNMVYTWGLWNQNVSIEKIISPQRILCWAAKFEGQSEVMWKGEYNTNRTYLFNMLAEILDETDFVVHFNGISFDMPMINAEFIQAGIKPPSPYKQIDLYKVASKQFRFPSNKLDYISQALNIGEKVKHPGFSLWTDCLAGKSDAWEIMRQYNIHDVELLEDLYKAMLPWIPYHPNRLLTELACPTCGSEELQKRGTYLARTRRYQRYVCKQCGAWSRSVKSTDDRAQVVGVRA